mgnify:CR=1 FL=1
MNPVKPDQILSADEYQRLATSTEAQPTFIRLPRKKGEKAKALKLREKQFGRLLHGAIGMCTEAGELQDNIKKALVYGKPLDVLNILEEVGDVFWYCAVALSSHGFTFQQAMDANIAKLRKRYPKGFQADRALNRDLSKEIKALAASTPSKSEKMRVSARKRASKSKKAVVFDRACMECGDPGHSYCARG